MEKTFRREKGVQIHSEKVRTGQMLKEVINRLLFNENPTN